MTKSGLLPIVLSAFAAACAGKPARAPSPSSSPPRSAAPGPSWFQQGDQATAEGNVFVCQGDGPSEDAALAAAHAVCNDKVCKLCGVEVESVVQTTETLKGVEMKRKVVERCRRFRKGEPKIVHKSSDCGPAGCVTWLSVMFSKEDEQKECAAYASEHFADPAECQRLIETFRKMTGQTAASFHTRAKLLDDAMIACKDIDVRPTPMVAALHEQLLAGMDAFESRGDRHGVAAYLYRCRPLRQQIKETPTLVGRIQLVRDYVHDRALVFDVIEALRAKDLDSVAGVARLLAAFRAAPVGERYGTPDVHFAGFLTLRDLRADLSPINQFFRDSYRPESLYHSPGIPLAGLFAKDRRVDETEWRYIFKLHTSHSCPVCVLYLLDAPDHGGAKLRDDRFFTFLNYEMAHARKSQNRRDILASSLPRDPQFMLHLRQILPPELRALLDWDFFAKRCDKAADDDDLAVVRALLPLLSASLTETPAAKVTPAYCVALPERLTYLRRKGAGLPRVDGQICACLAGPLANEGTRVFVNKSALYDLALAKALPCVQPK